VATHTTAPNWGDSHRFFMGKKEFLVVNWSQMGSYLTNYFSKLKLEAVMESVGLFLNAENVRTLVLLVAIVGSYVLIKRDMKFSLLELKIELLKEMDDRIEKANKSLYAQLKANDFKHLNDTIEALTYTLEKNGVLKREDKEYIDGRLDK
jgi:hypothetical protein